MFYDDFEYNSACFYDFRKLIHVMCVTGKNRSSFLHLALRPILHPVLSLVLHPALRPALKPWEIWWLSYQRPAMGESETWVFLVLMASNY
jgi:hypothetical protein